MAIQVLNFILGLFQTFFSFIFTLEITDGVYLGWVFVVVVLIGILLKFFLMDGDNDG